MIVIIKKNVSDLTLCLRDPRVFSQKSDKYHSNLWSLLLRAVPSERPAVRERGGAARSVSLTKVTRRRTPRILRAQRVMDLFDNKKPCKVTIACSWLVYAWKIRFSRGHLDSKQKRKRAQEGEEVRTEEAMRFTQHNMAFHRCSRFGAWEAFACHYVNVILKDSGSPMLL